MIRRILAFVTSCLLLAAFIGSAEAKAIPTSYSAGADTLRLASFGSGGTVASGWDLGEQAEDIDWLLAYYYGMETENPDILLNQVTDSPNETPATNEESEEDFSSKSSIEVMWLDYNLASSAYGDNVYGQTATLAQPAVDTEGILATFPREFYNRPPVIIYVPNNRHTPPLESPGLGPTPSPPPDGIRPAPVTPKVGSRPFPPTVVDKPMKPALPNRPGYFPPPKPGLEPPDNGMVQNPAPVPEPATMVLLSTGIAGLAFLGRRRR